MNVRRFCPRLTHGVDFPRLPLLGREAFFRAALVAITVAGAHQLQWQWLRFFTSEAILRMSELLGMTATWISFDAISVQGGVFHFVTSCTFVDVLAGAILLLWDFRKSAIRNVAWLCGACIVLYIFNLLRLEAAQMLYALGVSWTLADGVLGGVAYFAVWRFIWGQRSWGLAAASRSFISCQQAA